MRRAISALLVLLLLPGVMAADSSPHDRHVFVERQYVYDIERVIWTEEFNRELALPALTGMPQAEPIPVECTHGIFIDEGPDAFTFIDDDTDASCGLRVTLIPAPPGTKEFQVEFAAMREFNAEQGTFAYFNQDVQVEGPDGESHAWDYFEVRADPRTQWEPMSHRFPAAPGPLKVGFWFNDGGASPAVQAPTGGALLAYKGLLKDLQFAFTLDEPPIGQWKQSGIAGAVQLKPNDVLTLEIDAAPEGFGQRITIRSEMDHQMVALVAPDGTRYGPGAWQESSDGQQTVLVVPAAVFAQHGAGQYRAEFQQNIALVHQPVLATGVALLGFAQVAVIGFTTSTYVTTRPVFKRAKVSLGRYSVSAVILTVLAGLGMLVWLLVSDQWVAVASMPLTLPSIVVVGFLMVTGGSLLLLTQMMRSTEKVASHQVELERSNRELDEFSHIVTHDLRAPLRTVSTFASLLQKKHGDKLDKEGTEFVELVSGGVVRMSKLLDAVGHYSRVGTKKLLSEDVHLGELVADVRRDLRRDLIDSGARIHAANLPVVHAEPALLRELMLNLVQNAVKYRHPDRRPVIQIRAKMNAAGLVLTVSDNGAGMSDNEVRHIFEPFQRGTSSTQIPGTGMGLAVCRRIAERHGGKLDVESTLGVGTTFFLHLPDA